MGPGHGGCQALHQGRYCHQREVEHRRGARRARVRQAVLEGVHHRWRGCRLQRGGATALLRPPRRYQDRVPHHGHLRRPRRGHHQSSGRYRHDTDQDAGRRGHAGRLRRHDSWCYSGSDWGSYILQHDYSWCGRYGVRRQVLRCNGQQVHAVGRER